MLRCLAKACQKRLGLPVGWRIEGPTTKPWAAHCARVRIRKFPRPPSSLPSGLICNPPFPPVNRMMLATGCSGSNSRKRCVTPGRVGISTTVSACAKPHCRASSKSRKIRESGITAYSGKIGRAATGSMDDQLKIASASNSSCQKGSPYPPMDPGKPLSSAGSPAIKEWHSTFGYSRYLVF
jgi:hypothetical protein